MESLVFQTFQEVDHGDPFFDSLKQHDEAFSDWLMRKAKQGESAYVLYNNKQQVEGFMYLKPNDEGGNIVPPMPNGSYLKIGRLKFNPAGNHRGQRFLKKAIDTAFSLDIDYIYLTVSEEQTTLIDVVKIYGFREHGEKHSIYGSELVYIKSLIHYTGDILHDYPHIMIDNRSKYLLAMSPDLHTRLFPDSILDNEPSHIVTDISHTNSIHKVYICSMEHVMQMKPGDIIVIYRTESNHSPVFYKSVATSICVVEEIKHIHDFLNENEFICHCVNYTIFSRRELRYYYRIKKYPYIIRFTYNIALPKRPARNSLIQDVGLDEKEEWRAVKLTDCQFNKILEISCVNQSFVIN